MTADQKHALLTRLKTLGVYRLEAEYSGSGDSGQFDQFVCYDKDGTYMHSVDLDRTTGEDQALRRVTARLKDEEYTTFSDELEKVVWNAVDEAGHNGFWNNEGGEGKLVFDVGEGTIVLEHKNRVESWEEYAHEMGEDKDETADDAS